MKVFFIGDRKYPDYKSRYTKIVKKIESFGNSVDKTYISNSLDEEANPKELYMSNMKAIKNADIIVAEVTFLSGGLGFFISAALSQNKPVLALYNTEAKSKISRTISGSNEKLMSLEKYDSKNISDVLEKYFKIIKKKIDTKFILIISPEIDHYLEWASKEYRMHKAQIVRESVEKIMSKDKLYKKHLDN